MRKLLFLLLGCLIFCACTDNKPKKFEPKHGSTNDLSLLSYCRQSEDQCTIVSWYQFNGQLRTVYADPVAQGCRWVFDDKKLFYWRKCTVDPLDPYGTPKSLLFGFKEYR